jgi:hypothetical protein|uniref:Uncharacterized protein n=1 Tax=Globisporangium ultimum (strain ATCC 200006 / CBS 805.95 / DAOM BR144) TaxID=431595 RepID=K3WBD4_GLOUD
MAAQRAPRRARRSPEANGGEHALAQTLRIGGLHFLTLRGAVAVLSTCAAFRSDAQLALSALAASRHGPHLFQHCNSDWFDLIPRRIVGENELFSECGGFHTHGELVARLQAAVQGALDRPAWRPSQLLALVSQMETFVVPACKNAPVSLSSYGDLVASIPVVIPLWERLPDAQKEAAGDPKVWTRISVREALNAIHPSFGDNFTNQDPANAFVSQFGAHWDSIRQADVKGDVECSLCMMSVEAMDQFKKHRKEWCDQCDAEKEDAIASFGVGDIADPPLAAGAAQVLEDRLNEIEHEYFPDGERDEDLSDRDILERVIDTKQVKFPPFPQETGLSSDDLVEALDDTYGYPGQCRLFSQPLKRFLLQNCRFTNRIKYDWIPKSAFNVPGDYSHMRVELVAGVTPSGFLCGVFVATQMTL